MRLTGYSLGWELAFGSWAMLPPERINACGAVLQDSLTDSKDHYNHSGPTDSSD